MRKKIKKEIPRNKPTSASIVKTSGTPVKELLHFIPLPWRALSNEEWNTKPVQISLSFFFFLT
jgi:hypothetical protein